MTGALYKHILRKLDLSVVQLEKLKGKLTTENICKGPFLSGNKMCPNTTALAIKQGVDAFQATGQVKGLLKEYRVNRVELWIFYAVFDIPALTSKNFFENALVLMRSAINELIQEKRNV